MRVLDLDLDFFQAGIVIYPQSDERPSIDDHPPWSRDQVAEFLESSCGLDRSRPLPGHLVVTHDGVFHCWRRQLASGGLSAPFDVVHVDAHADLSMGSAGWSRVCFDLLHVPQAHRASAASKMADETDFLLFAIACGWVGRITYVYHPESPLMDGIPSDLKGLLFRGFDRTSGVIELPCFAEDDRLRSVTDGRVPPLRREPPVPFTAIPMVEFAVDGGFDIAFLSMSPRYTAPVADGLLEVFRDYIRFEESEDGSSDATALDFLRR